MDVLDGTTYRERNFWTRQAATEKLPVELDATRSPPPELQELEKRRIRKRKKKKTMSNSCHTAVAKCDDGPRLRPTGRNSGRWDLDFWWWRSAWGEQWVRRYQMQVERLASRSTSTDQVHRPRRLQPALGLQKTNASI